MTEIVWDAEADRLFEVGLDRGVLYPNTTVAVPWNGLISIDIGSEGSDVTPMHFDGVKVFDSVNPGDFSAKLTAVTYPEKFNELVGVQEFGAGLSVSHQARDTFGLSYRTGLGSYEDGVDHGYKIHILYNLTAFSDDVSYQTMGSNVEPIDFAWNITSVPEPVLGHRPSSHFIIDSTRTDIEVITALEDILYGTETTDPRLPTISEIFDFVTIIIIDNEDGTWTAILPDYLLTMLDDHTFQIEHATAVYLNDYTYEISST